MSLFGGVIKRDVFYGKRTVDAKCRSDATIQCVSKYGKCDVKKSNPVRAKIDVKAAIEEGRE